MSIMTSTELFINMKRIPDVTSSEYTPFFKEEQRKIKNGVTINGTRIPSWLYWHINHWMIDIDGPRDPITGYKERLKLTPFLRDNDWIIAEHIQKAEQQRKGLLILGSRQLGKSEIGASYEGFRGVNFKNSQNVIAGLSTPDLSLLLHKLDRGFKALHPYFKPLRIKDDWKNEVTLGYKNPQGERYTYSEFLIRNLDAGKNTENLAGPTTSSILLDEVGKGSFLQSFVAARPALETEDGFRGPALFLGTSGSFTQGADLEHFRGNLDAYNFMEIELNATNGRSYNFIPGFQSSKAKRKKVRLSTYLKVPRGSELDEIPIHVVADVDAEITKIKAEIEAYKASKDITSSKQTQMYYPLEEEDLFLTEDVNNIYSNAKDVCREHLKYLEEVGVDEDYIFLTRGSDGKPKEVPTDKIPIQNFPALDTEDLDAPIIVWERPMEGQEFGVLHVSGADPYNQDQSYYSDSLGTVYIYRRMYDPLNGQFQNMFVACYAARPKDIKKWREQFRLLLEWYGATCLPESEEPGLIRWFDEKLISHYLEDSITLSQEINPNTKTGGRIKGLAATIPNIKYGNTLLANYITEDLIVGVDAEGNNIIKKGVIRIKDKVLLKEVIAYKPAVHDVKTGKKKKKATNVDRIVGARHALIIAFMKDKYFPIAKLHAKPSQNRPKRKQAKMPFRMSGGSPFKGMGKKGPFRGR